MRERFSVARYRDRITLLIFSLVLALANRGELALSQGEAYSALTEAKKADESVEILISDLVTAPFNPLRVVTAVSLTGDLRSAPGVFVHRSAVDDRQRGGGGREYFVGLRMRLTRSMLESGDVRYLFLLFGEGQRFAATPVRQLTAEQAQDLLVSRDVLRERVSRLERELSAEYAKRPPSGSAVSDVARDVSQIVDLERFRRELQLVRDLESRVRHIESELSYVNGLLQSADNESFGDHNMGDNADDEASDLMAIDKERAELSMQLVRASLISAGALREVRALQDRAHSEFRLKLSLLEDRSSYESIDRGAIATELARLRAEREQLERLLRERASSNRVTEVSEQEE